MPNEAIQQEAAQNEASVDSRPNDNSERILAAAAGFFESKGVARTRIADIMRAEDLTRELFYYYYTNKNELVESVVECYREACFAALREAVDEAGPSPELRLQAAARVTMELFYGEDCGHTAMARVFDELGIFRQMLGEMARFGAICTYGPDADSEFLRKTAVLLLSCVGMAAVCDGDREQCLGQAKRMISHVLAMV